VFPAALLSRQDVQLFSRIRQVGEMMARGQALRDGQQILFILLEEDLQLAGN